MAFIMVRIEVPGKSDTELNQQVKSSANQREGVILLRNLVEAALAGATPSQIDVAVRATTQAITADGNGITASYNLK